MSFSGTRSRVIAPRVSQIFKKRNDLINTSVPINSNATLLGSVVLQETGTLYAITVSLYTLSVDAIAGDIQRIVLWVRCVPSGATLPDFTDNAVMDTTNGFSLATLIGVAENAGGNQSYVNEKFRYRRKCDDATIIQLIAQSTTISGTGRVQDVSGHFSAIIRMR